MAAKEEWGIQKAVIKWFDGQYPETHEFWHLLCYNQNGSVNFGKIKGYILKLMGVRAGIPDLTLYVARGGWHGLLVEIKTEKGKFAKNQETFHKRFINQGFAVEGGYGVDHSIMIIKQYLLGRNIRRYEWTPGTQQPR